MERKKEGETMPNRLQQASPVCQQVFLCGIERRREGERVRSGWWVDVRELMNEEDKGRIEDTTKWSNGASGVRNTKK